MQSLDLFFWQRSRFGNDQKTTRLVRNFRQLFLREKIEDKSRIEEFLAIFFGKRGPSWLIDGQVKESSADVLDRFDSVLRCRLRALFEKPKIWFFIVLSAKRSCHCQHDYAGEYEPV